MIERKIGSNKIPVATAALVIFSLLGLIYYKFYPHSFVAKKQEKKKLQIAQEFTSKTKPFFVSKAPIEVKISPNVQEVLDSFFEGSPYKVNTLPVYPTIISKNHHPERKLMTAPIMKASTVDGRPMIFIKVNCILDPNDENLKSYIEYVIEKYRKYPKLEKILIIGQYYSDGPLCYGGDGENLWDQLDREAFMAPRFFTWNFTYDDDGSGPTESQKAKVPAFKKLLQTGESQDLRGRTWQIPEHPALNK